MTPNNCLDKSGSFTIRDIDITRYQHHLKVRSRPSKQDSPTNLTWDEQETLLHVLHELHHPGLVQCGHVHCGRCGDIKWRWLSYHLSYLSVSQYCRVRLWRWRIAEDCLCCYLQGVVFQCGIRYSEWVTETEQNMRSRMTEMINAALLRHNSRQTLQHWAHWAVSTLTN